MEAQWTAASSSQCTFSPRSLYLLWEMPPSIPRGRAGMTDRKGIQWTARGLQWVLWVWTRDPMRDGEKFPRALRKDKSWCICWNGVPVGGLTLLEPFSYHRRKPWKWLRQPQMRKQDYSHIVEAERTDGEKAGPFRQCGSKLAWGLGTSQEC